AAADLAGRGGLLVPPQRHGGRHLAGWHLQRAAEDVLRVPGRARHEQDLVAVAAVLLGDDLRARAPIRPQVEPVAERVADVADDVAGVLLGDLRSERRPLLPGLR